MIAPTRQRPRHRIDRRSSDIGDFLDSLAERGASIKTIEAYGTDLDQPVEFLTLRRQATGWNRLDSAAIERFIDNLKSSGYRNSSVARKLAALRGFFAFLAEEGVVRINPAKELRHPRDSKARTRPLTPEEAGALLKLVGERSTAGANRDRAMLELLYTTGMRVSELVSLNVEDLKLDPQDPYVVCPGARGKKGAISIVDEAVAALSDYLMQVRPKLVQSEKESSLFVSQRGQRLTRQGFWLRLKGYARAANLADVSPQSFRASFARRAPEGEVTEGNVHATLGHSRGPQRHHLPANKWL
jgi:integrase/recombinase XerD